ncbi:MULTISPECIES: 3-hydroxyacyl-CoA dehydrogenase NAD-binding domain-containing protein [unclassified Caballeronia]|uniref:3-hydroxyacyl-CoA dehydrogenase NAD-binding domain-containing protein n=1 Tax=unclassified Caballeronia TaxID=2646786 RepID=UPI0028555EDE|nr:MULTISPECIES: 3-hydroxyacyl-CoA dehydrogenase NAD-binding domain-containing protein [unclassified Caballeronia]MDR5754676.1 3-hydroxyacyl-CoA dehydrogenase NAD-binding domain-containing protein [Caballeronia sp. LZ024]MDR5839822.1 3-hydroxyacyl-CoA dehydrogenase NAD-binding domain-containing protein [Caballeronia sp. LZ031]
MTKRAVKIAIVGAGVIGAGWATHFLAHGFDVTATDPADGAELRLRAWIDDNWTAVERLGLANGASRENLVFTTDLDAALRDADFIQESGPERLDVKQALIASIESAAKPEAIIASSSSGLSVSEIQAGAKHPERIVLGHPFNPSHIIPLVEVGGGALTSPGSIATAMALYASTGKKVIRINKEVKGHIANRLQVAIWQEAFSLVQRGVATVEDIDTAIAYGPGLRWALLGPFLNLHASGGSGGITHVLRHLGAAQREWARDLGTYPETDDYIESIARGVETTLQAHDFAEMIRQRDQLLIELLEAKRKLSQIP